MTLITLRVLGANFGPSGGFLNSRRERAEDGSVGALGGGSRSRLVVVWACCTGSLLEGAALNFWEISGFGAAGVGFEEGLNAKLNLPAPLLGLGVGCDETSVPSLDAFIWLAGADGASSG